MILSALDDYEVKKYGHNLLYHPQLQRGSFSSIAQLCTQYLYNAFTAPDNSPGFALLRIFRTVMHDDLTDELKARARGTGRHVVLMGSNGAYPEWCDPTLSKKRRIQAVDNRLSPMFQGVFSELGFPIEILGEMTVPTGTAGDMNSVRLFYIADAIRSPYIGDQETFVQPYGIRSMIALGTRFLSGDAYTLIGFTTVPLSSNNAEAFGGLSMYLATLLARFDNREKLW